MTNKEALELYQNLHKPVMKNISGAKCVYAISRTKDILKRELTLLEGAAEMSEKYQEFDGKRIEFAKQFASKDDKGEFIVKNNEFDIPVDKMPEVIKLIDELRKEYKDTITEREKQLKDYSELLEKTISFELHYIASKDLPDALTQEQMDYLYPLCKEEIA